MLTSWGGRVVRRRASSSPIFEARVLEALNLRKLAGTFRETKAASAADGALKNARGPLVDFASNDYLGLARETSIAVAALTEEAQRVFATESPQLNGSTGARLLSGASSCHGDLERFLAEFHGRESALLFNSGYAANAGAMQALPGPDDCVFYDALSHNASRFGMRAGRQRSSRPFAHNDVAALRDAIRSQREAERLTDLPRGTFWVAVEAVYSMDGDEAPLAALAECCLEDGDALLVVDEAHSTGILGRQGRGATHALPSELRATVACQVHTFGKAVGCHGAAALCDDSARDYLCNYAQPFIYSTSLSPAHSRLARRCYEELVSCEGDARRTHLAALVEAFRSGLGHLEERALPSRSPIQAVLVPGAKAASRAADQLRHAGFDVRAIRAPTVPAGAERLRVIIHAHNSLAEVLSLVSTIRKVLRSADEYYERYFLATRT